MSEESKKKKDLDLVKREDRYSDLEEDFHRNRDENDENVEEQNSKLKAIKYWMGDYEPIKLCKIS